MPRKSHPEEKIVYALRQAEAGKKVNDICREMGVSQQAFYSWRRRYAGLGLTELRELRQLSRLVSFLSSASEWMSSTFVSRRSRY